MTTELFSKKVKLTTTNKKKLNHLIDHQIGENYLDSD